MSNSVYGSIFESNITSKEELVGERLIIQAFEATTGSVEENGKKRSIPSWRVRATHEETGEAVMFLMGRNSVRDDLALNINSLIARHGVYPIVTLKTRQINHATVGMADMYEFELLGETTK